MMFKLPTPMTIVSRQRVEAERLRLEHAAAAEHHAALARMYDERIARLDKLQSGPQARTTA